MHSKSLVVGEWRLNIDHGSLIRDQEERVIGAQNMALLVYFAAHPNQLLTRETLLNEVWKGVVVNDNTLSKAVAELRKALGDEHRQASYIVTVPRQGYRLIAPVHATDHVESKTFSHYRLPMLFAAAVTMLLGIWWYRSAPPPALEGAAFSRLLPATTEPGIEMHPSFSPDGRWLAYVSMHNDNQHNAIKLKALDDSGIVTLIKSESALEQPVWSPDGRQLAYLDHGTQGCRVRLVRLQVNSMQADSDSALAACATRTAIGFNTLRWSHDGNALLVYQQHDDAPELTRLDWRSGEQVALPLPNSYVFAVHPAKPLLVFASADVLSTRLFQYRFDQREPTPLLQRNEIFFGMAFDPGSDNLVTTSSLIGGQLELIKPDGQHQVLWPSSDPLIDPAFSADGKKLAVTQVRFTYDLWSASLADGEPSRRPLIQSSRFDYSPRFAHSGERLAFISTRGGAPAVWFAKADGSDAKQAVTLPDQQWPIHLRWSPDDRFLSIGTTGFRAYRYDLISQQLEALADADVALMNPSWSAEGDAIYAARYVQQQWQIWRFPMQGEASALTHQQQPITGMLAEQITGGECMYVLRYGDSTERGVWCYRPNETPEQLLSFALNRHNWQNFQATQDGFYFLDERQQHHSVYHWQRNGSVKPLLSLTSLMDAGPLFINFTVHPDQKQIVYTHVADFESDIMILQ